MILISALPTESMILISALPTERMILSAGAESTILSVGSAKQLSTKCCSGKCGNEGGGRGNSGGGNRSVVATMTAVPTGAESIILSVNAESIILSAPPAEIMILSVPPAGRMILSAPLSDTTHKHTGPARQRCVVP